MCYQSDLAGIQTELYAFVKNRVNDESDADDVVQESNKVLINKEEHYNSNYPFRSWALGIAKWQVLAYYKRVKRAIPTLSIDVSEELNPNWLSDVPFASLIKKERLELIKRLNHILSNRQRQVFNLLIEGFTHQEISDILETSKINVQVLKARLIKRIRNFVSNNENENYYKY
jgi:RNA polymerase sigma-70 factor (ECF subfamily)